VQHIFVLAPIPGSVGRLVAHALELGRAGRLELKGIERVTNLL